MLSQGGLSVFYGLPGTGKTFIALDLATAVATGSPWMGRRTTQGPVIYAAGEGVAGLRLRRAAIEKKRGFKTPPPVAFLPRALSTPEEINKFASMLDEVARKHASPALLILDTLNRYFGEGEENSAKDMARFLKAIGSLHNRYPDLHILIVHHSGKDQDKGMRGSSALKGAADTVIQCTKTSEGRFVARIEKQKDGPETLAFPFALEEVDLGADADGGPITSCVVVPDQTGNSVALTGHRATAVRILRSLKPSVTTGGGNLAAYLAEIPYNDFRARWLQEHPNDKEDSARKAALRQVEALKEQNLVEWAGDKGPIRLLPTFETVTIA